MQESRTCQAESERHLNMERVGSRSRAANIRPADDIVSEKVSDNGVGMGEVRRRRQERLAGFPVGDGHQGYVLGMR